MSKSSDTRPLISVIMGVYNSQRTLYEAVKSILDQSYSNFEFVICDDASTDDSLKLLDSFNDHRLKMMWSTKNGPLGLVEKDLSSSTF